MRSSRQHFLQRYWVIGVILGAIFIVIILRLIWVLSDAHLEQKGYDQTHKTIAFNYDRGQIFDRNNNIIAGNIITANIIINPQNLYIPNLNNVVSVWKLSERYQKKKNTLLTSIIRDDNIVEHFSHISSFNMLEFMQSFEPKEGESLNQRIKQYQTQCIQTGSCDKYHVLLKKENILSRKIEKLHEFKQQKFLVCSTVEKGKSKFERFLSMIIHTPQETTIVCKKIKDTAFSFEYHPKRIYPFSPSTTPSIGALNYKHEGVFGLESTYENYLHHGGYDASINKRAASHTPYYDIDLSAINKDNDITLTLDNTIQFYLYDGIAQAVDKFEAKSGAGIILNPNGEILAMASYPTNDVNTFISDNSDFYLNRVLTDNLEIASTIKPLLTLALLNEGKINLDEVIHFTREETQARDYTHYDSLTIREIIEKSYTPGSIKITKRLDDERLHHYLTQFGFNTSTDVLPNIENSGYLKDIYSWSAAYMETLSYGYGISATLAQLARAYLVFANDGVLKNLKLLPNTQDISYRVVTPNSAQQMIPVLESVVEKGTAKHAQPDFYKAFGKTGTAQLLLNGKYTRNRTNAFFVGLAPSNGVKYIMAVVINDPRKGYLKDGGEISAPIFKKVLDNIL